MAAATDAARIAAKILATLGDAKIPPRIAPDNIPVPIHPAWDGSWPLPPPDNNCTVPDDDGFFVVKTTLWFWSLTRLFGYCNNSPEINSSTDFVGSFKIFLGFGMVDGISSCSESGIILSSDQLLSLSLSLSLKPFDSIATVELFVALVGKEAKI